ncbi:MAG: hypothetical protein ACOY4I_04715 [Bacillota bacterium]
MDPENMDQVETQGTEDFSEATGQDFNNEGPKGQDGETVQAGGTSGQTEGESFTSIDVKNLPPEMQTLHKSLLSDYTKKTQAIAEERKALETAKQTYGWVDELNQIASQDPRAAAARLRAAADHLEKVKPDPLAQHGITLDEMTPTERLLYAQLQQMQQALGQVYQQTNGYFQTQAQREESARVERELSGIREKYHADVTTEQWAVIENQIKETAQQNGIKNMEAAYRVAFFDDAEKRGLNKAYQSMQAKKKATLPGGSQSGKNAVPAGGTYNSIWDAFNEAKAELGIK